MATLRFFLSKPQHLPVRLCARSLSLETQSNQKSSKSLKTSKSTKTSEVIDPSLGPNPAYDAALNWFNDMREKKQTSISGLTEQVDSLKKRIEELQKKWSVEPSTAIKEELVASQNQITRFEEQISRLRESFIKSDPAREKKARLGLEVVEFPSLENLTNQQWREYKADSRLRQMGKYWGIFDDVIPPPKVSQEQDEKSQNHSKSMYPTINLIVKYQDTLIHRGHQISPTLTMEKPLIKFASDHPNTSYTLLMVDADEPHEQEQQLKESVHYLVTNIETSEANTVNPISGETILDYIPPHPARGSDFHRFVFILFKQNSKNIQIENPPTKLDRFRETKAFMEKYGLEPVGFCFFRSTWNESVSQVYSSLGIKEPLWVDPQQKK